MDNMTPFVPGGNWDFDFNNTDNKLKVHHIEYKILAAGCSFTKCPRLPIGNNFGGYSYCDYLPGKVYNIGEPGVGITKHVIERFVRENKGIELTHFIYQVPSPSRQPIDLNEQRHSQFHIREDNPEKKTITHGYHDTKLNENNIWNTLVLFCSDRETGRWRKIESITSKRLTEIFTNHEKYLNKAIDRVHINVKFIRERYPDIKIIFLRYEVNTIPLLNAFCKDWYKNTLNDYCRENDITYIYEKNFNTKWFKNNNMTTDSVHPDKEGTRIIADKIKEYL